MITQLRLGNARVFDGEAWEFPISRLTILCGENSAGKSTVLRCLLLLRQALLSREGSLVPESRSKLRFAGGLTDLGNFRSFVSHNDVEKDLILGISITAAMDGSGLLLSKEQSPPSDGTGNIEENDLQYIPYELKADFRFGMQSSLVASVDASQAITAENDETRTSDNHAVLKGAQFSISHEGKVLLAFELLMETTSLPNGVGYLLRLPRSYLARLPELESVALDEDKTQSEYVDLRTALRGCLPERILAKPRSEELAPVRYWPLPSHIEEVLQDLRMTLFRMSYLGPLRAPAQRYYTGQGDSNVDSDVSGESLPYILRDKIEDLVFSATPIEHKPERVPMSTALDAWLFYLRTGERAPTSRECKGELSVSSVQEVLVSLGIKSSYGLESHALADSGFGYSQVLPILVKGLMLSRGSLLIIEQPEVHLNPALQVRLSDFLVAMASRDKQILIETHSEHIVNTVRAVSAESHTRKQSDQYTILYLAADQHKPTLHKLSILRDGTVPEWPSTFFGESSQLFGRILRAQRKLRT